VGQGVLSPLLPRGDEMNSKRKETRIACSMETLQALRTYKRGGEAYDTLIRRLLISGHPKPIDDLTDQEREWVLNVSSN
jgi:hypothetical protein